MPQDRPNLILDERSFEGLLSAAFTIQEHNDRRKRADLGKNQKVASSFCPHCGAPKSTQGSRCGTCGQDEFRPGEKMQRNWASMWSESQNQEQLEAEKPARNEEPALFAAPSPAKSAFALSQPVTEASENISIEDIERSLPQAFVTEDNFVETNSEHFAHGQHFTADGDFATTDGSDGSEDSQEGAGGTGTVYSNETQPTDTRLVHSAFKFESGHDLDTKFDFDLDAKHEPEVKHGPIALLLKQVSNLRVKLRFRRADLYLGLSVFVAAVAMIWPSAIPRRPSSLSAWERALVTIGIAEAPAQLVHLQGDPGVSVWVDPHTALYYCDGDDQYQHTPDGRLSSQHDAQMDRFEPAGRAACE